jgi:hypothetical protein
VLRQARIVVVDLPEVGHLFERQRSKVVLAVRDRCGGPKLSKACTCRRSSACSRPVRASTPEVRHTRPPAKLRRKASFSRAMVSPAVAIVMPRHRSRNQG